MKFRLLITVLVLNFIFIIPLNAELFSPFNTNTNGVAFGYMVNDFPTHIAMNAGESRIFSITVVRMDANSNATYTGRWFKDNIAIGDEFDIYIPDLRVTEVNLNIINANLFQSGVYNLRVTTIYNDTITHIDTSRNMVLLVNNNITQQTPNPTPPPTTAPETQTAAVSIHVGTQWGAPISNMLSFPVSTKGIADGFYRISLSGLPSDSQTPNQARIHNGIFNPQLHIRNIWTAEPGNYLIRLTLYDSTGNIIAESNEFLLMIFDPWR